VADFCCITAKHKPLLYFCITTLKLQILLCTVSITLLFTDVISTKGTYLLTTKQFLAPFTLAIELSAILSIDGNSIVNGNTKKVATSAMHDAAGADEIVVLGCCGSRWTNCFLHEC